MDGSQEEIRGHGEPGSQRESTTRRGLLLGPHRETITVWTSPFWRERMRNLPYRDSVRDVSVGSKGLP